MTDFPFLGEIAALITAVCFAVTATLFTFAGRSIGSEMVNRTRLILALAILMIVHQVLYGSLLPLDAARERWYWLSLSGVIGFAMGDAFLFQAFLVIGPRLGMLLMSLAPVMAAFLGRWFLGEVLGTMQWLGIALTVAGIAWVVAERQGNGDKGVAAAPSLNPDVHPIRRLGMMRNHVKLDRTFTLGLFFGLLAAAGQASGAVLSKLGLGGDFSPISGNIIRILAASVFIWLFYGLRGKIPESVELVRKFPRILLLMLLGAVFGPVVGVSFSLLAIQHTAVGVASTLIATTPIFMLPISHFIFHDRFGWQAVAGTAVTILGVGLLFSG